MKEQMSARPCFPDLLNPERKERKGPGEPWEVRGGEGRVRHVSSPTARTGPYSRALPIVASPKVRRLRLQGFQENKYRNLSSSPAPPPHNSPKMSPRLEPEPSNQIRTIRCPDVATEPLTSLPCSFPEHLLCTRQDGKFPCPQELTTRTHESDFEMVWPDQRGADICLRSHSRVW